MISRTHLQQHTTPYHTIHSENYVHLAEDRGMIKRENSNIIHGMIQCLPWEPSPREKDYQCIVHAVGHRLCVDVLLAIANFLFRLLLSFEAFRLVACLQLD